MRKTTPKGFIILLLTAVIWGSSFVSQSIGIRSVDAFTFMALRTSLGTLFLLPIIIFINSGIKGLIDRRTLKAGIILGIVLAAAQNLQQFAFYYSTSGKIAFLTALYMFFVPILGIFLGKKISPATWTAICIAVIGLFLLCVNPGELTDINRGDILAIACAVVYAVQIMLVDKFTEEDIDGIRLSFTEFLFAALISSALMFIFEKPTLTGIREASPAILYSGIMSCGIAYTLQVIGQKHASPVVASLLMCMESVFAALAGWLVLRESLSPKELAGCVIMFVAIIISQVSESVSMQRKADGRT